MTAIIRNALNILFLIVLSTATSFAEDGACNVSKSMQVDLTGDGIEEAVIARVNGDDCDNAYFYVEIFKDGSVAYRFTHSVNDMYVGHPSTVASQEAHNVLGGVAVNTEVTPIDEVFAPEDAPGITELRFVDRDKYIELSQSGLPYLAYPSWYEGYHYVIYDRAEDKFVVFGGF